MPTPASLSLRHDAPRPTLARIPLRYPLSPRHHKAALRSSRRNGHQQHDEGCILKTEARSGARLEREDRVGGASANTFIKHPLTFVLPGTKGEATQVSSCHKPHRAAPSTLYTAGRSTTVSTNRLTFVLPAIKTTPTI